MSELVHRWRLRSRARLLRHPVLLLRKLQRRLGLSAPPATPRPPQAHAQPLPSLLAALTQWAEACGASYGSHSGVRLFGCDFEKGDLFDLLRNGPESAPGLRGDRKLLWEAARGYAFPWTALALSGGESVEPLAARMREWQREIDVSPATWDCAMEVAVRAVNWLASDAVLQGRLRTAYGPDAWDDWMWKHGQAIWRNLEIYLSHTSNHYLANLLGLSWLGAAFREAADGEGWRSFANREFPLALAAQSYDDGGLYEASLPYHVLVTEMALLFVLVQPEALKGRRFRDRLTSMVQVLADMDDGTGGVFQVGDNDSGRVLAPETSSGGYAACVLRLAERVLGTRCVTASQALYPASGWWVSRRGPVTVMMTFGGIGSAGKGGHTHSDRLSLCVSWKGQPVLVDPGSYLYEPDPAARDLFRSTAMHSTPTIDGCEWSRAPQGSDDLFRLTGPILPGRVCSESQGEIAVEVAAPAETRRGCWVRRRVRVRDARLKVQDRVRGPGRRTACVRFHVHPDIAVSLDRDAALLSLSDGTRLRLRDADGGVLPDIEDAWYSPAYGQRVRSRILKWDFEFEDLLEATWVLELR